MKVQVYPPPFAKLKDLDEDGMLTLETGANLYAVYRRLGIPLALQPLIICNVNYERVKMKTRLKDGDIISFILPLTGG